MKILQKLSALQRWPVIFEKPKTLLEPSNENNVTVSILICNENDVTISIFIQLGMQTMEPLLYAGMMPSYACNQLFSAVMYTVFWNKSFECT
jgi:hypothetical protein